MAEKWTLCENCGAPTFGKEDCSYCGCPNPRLIPPAAPQCSAGLNKNSCRTWVNIKDEQGRRLYGFCGFRSPGPQDRDGIRVQLGQRANDQRIPP